MLHPWQQECPQTSSFSKKKISLDKNEAVGLADERHFINDSKIDLTPSETLFLEQESGCGGVQIKKKHQNQRDYHNPTPQSCKM